VDPAVDPGVDPAGNQSFAGESLEGWEVALPDVEPLSDDDP
jgi:hypothetical protein